MIERGERNIDIVKGMAGYYPVVTVMGPRQSGKTTLVRALFPGLEAKGE